jgi:hypothetical protein
MRGVKQAVTAAGTVIESCPGCRANPVRNHPEMETLDAEKNWTRTCPDCERKLCIGCYPEKALRCCLDDCEAIALALDLEATVAADVSVEIARDADAEIADRDASDAADFKYWEEE